MSWTMWHVHGYGFDVAGVTANKLVAFCDNHAKALDSYGNAKLLRDTIAEYKEEPIGDAEFYDGFLEMTEFGAVGDVVAHIIRQETHLDFFSPSLTDESEDCVLFGPAYPWQFNDTENELKSPEELLDKARPYAAELGVEDTLGEFDLVYAG